MMIAYRIQTNKNLFIEITGKYDTDKPSLLPLRLNKGKKMFGKKELLLSVVHVCFVVWF